VWANWRARLRLFEKVGGRWIAGASFAARTMPTRPAAGASEAIPDPLWASRNRPSMTGVFGSGGGTAATGSYRMDETDEAFQRAMAAPRTTSSEPGRRGGHMRELRSIPAWI